MPLTAYWIRGPNDSGSLGYGVTAHSPEDAWAIVEHAGYSLPTEKKALSFRVVRSVDDVAIRYVSEHSGPIVVRGLWYPFTRVGTHVEAPIQLPEPTSGLTPGRGSS